MSRWIPFLAVLAFLVTIAYAVAPGPYTIAAFAFVAMPLFVLVLIGYVAVVIQDLRGKQVL